MPRVMLIASCLLLATFAVVLVSCSDSSADGKSPPLLTTPVDSRSADRYALPDGDAEALFEFIENLKQYEPRTNPDAERHYEQLPKAIAAAAAKIMELHPDPTSTLHQRAALEALDIRLATIVLADEEQRRETVAELLEVVREAGKQSPVAAMEHVDRFMFTVEQLRGIDERELASQAMAEFADIFSAMEESKLADVIDQLRIQARVIRIPLVAAEEQSAIFNEIAERAGNADLETLKEKYLTMLQLTLQEIEETSNAELKATAYRKAADILAATGASEFASYIEYFEGSARSFEMIGQPMELSGKTYQGTDFDWQAYRGKVVLVNFWATWCHACLEEMPRLREVYDEYRERGFEVVGISLDENQSELARFMATKGMPWTVLHHADGPHPAAEKYFVNSIPEQILVDQDGNVLARGVRADDLPEQLEQLLK